MITHYCSFRGIRKGTSEDKWRRHPVKHHELLTTAQLKIRLEEEFDSVRAVKLEEYERVGYN